MAVGITFTVDGLKEVQAKYKALGKDFAPNAKTVRTLLKKFLIVMHASTARNFQAQGRPTKWKPLAASTLARRRQGKKTRLGLGMILQDTGRLRQSVMHGPPARGAVTRYAAMAVEFGTNLAYAAIHQFGFHGSQAVKAHIRKVETRNTFETAGGKRRKTGSGVAYVRAFVRQMNMPARPFLVFQEDDKKEMRVTLVDHFKEWDKDHRIGPKGKA